MIVKQVYRNAGGKTKGRNRADYAAAFWALAWVRAAGGILRIGLMGHSSTRENVRLILEKLEASLRAEGYRS